MIFREDSRRKGRRPWEYYYILGIMPGALANTSSNSKVLLTDTLGDVTVIISYIRKPTIPVVKGLTRSEGKKGPSSVAWAQGR